MKKILPILLCVIMLLSVSACGTKILNPATLEQITTEVAEDTDAKDITTEMSTTTMLTKEEVLDIAAKDAQVTEVRLVEISLDKELRKSIYEVDFKSGNYEYEYNIDAFSGEILWKTHELDVYPLDTTKENSAEQSNSSNELSDDKIKEIVFSEANVQEEDTQFLQIEKDYDAMRSEIDVEFYAGNNEYNYTLDEQGNILEFEVDNNF